jgi:hypothetical protein
LGNLIKGWEYLKIIDKYQLASRGKGTDVHQFVLISSILFFGVVGLAKSSWPACIGSSPSWTSTADYASVAACVAGASPEDTIHVTAGSGSVTWNNYLRPYGVQLIGPGKDKLTVTLASCYNGSIEILGSSADLKTRISGFTFNQTATDPTCVGLFQLNRGGTQPKQLRIDHNSFITSHALFAVWNPGIWGVVDNNTISAPFVSRMSWGDGSRYWINGPNLSLGDGNTLIFEDNDITVTSDMVSDCNFAGRYVYRYNTISGSGGHPSFDMHGNCKGTYSCFGGEVYGNNVLFNETSSYLFQQRGGQALWFYNNVRDTNMSPNAAGSLEEEESDDAHGGYANIFPMKVTDTYIWLNKIGMTFDFSYGITAVGTDGSTCNVSPTNAPVENTDWFQDNQNCEYPNTCPNITSGIGCGTLAARPATCTSGVGYWATNQSCSNLTGLVGANPSTPISGTLYRCTTPNIWRAYYTPYTYPHPLRLADSSDTTPPAAPTGLMVN